MMPITVAAGLNLSSQLNYACILVSMSAKERIFTLFVGLVSEGAEHHEAATSVVWVMHVDCSGELEQLSVSDT